MSIFTTENPPCGCPEGVRVVVKIGAGFIRFQRVSSNDEENIVKAAWQRRDYRYWPGRLLETGPDGFLREQR